MTVRQVPLAPVREWACLDIGDRPDVRQVTETEAEALLNAAAAHPLAKQDGANILVRTSRRRLRAQQMVGVLTAQGCTLEILPKVDPDIPDGDTEVSGLRHQLVRMLDIAYDLDIGAGAPTAMGRQAQSLLDIFVASFAENLLQETRRGLPRAYVGHQEDLPRLRGRLDVVRQFSHLAVRPDRLACRFDEMTSDIPLMQIMKATVRFLDRHARSGHSKRVLADLRFALADISDISDTGTLWRQVRIDRTNQRWQRLLRMAQLLLQRDWQATSSAPHAPEGISLLFPMNELFERYIGKMLCRALAGSDTEVILQGGHQNCLGDWTDDGHPVRANTFSTQPDIILKRDDRIVGIIDTKWKRLSSPFVDRRKGVQQSDVYQLMAYARIYWPPLNSRPPQGNKDGQKPRLMLLYPAIPAEDQEIVHRYGVHAGPEMIALGRVDVSQSPAEVRDSLRRLADELVAEAS